MKKVILITGCSTGFGRLAAETLGKEGHTVYASMRNTGSKNASVKGELLDFAKKENLSIQVLDLDVTKDSSVDQAVKTIVDKEGRIDVLINNAGVMYVGVTESFTLEQIQHQFDTNFFGVVRLNRAVLPHMREKKDGLLIHLSSIAGRIVLPFFGVYNASKYALEALAESYRYELSQLGIDSVIVEPGPFHTNIINASPSGSDQERISKYGALAERPSNMLSAFNDFFASENTTNPQEVVAVISKLIAAKPGERPLRTVVGPDYGVVKINEFGEGLQPGLMEGIGMSDLMKLAVD